MPSRLKKEAETIGRYVPARKLSFSRKLDTNVM